MRKRIYQLFVLFLISSLLMNCQKEPSVAGTYVLQWYIKPITRGCCSSTEIVKLNNDLSFNFYGNNNQGDYEISEVFEGKYQRDKNIISFLFDKPTKLDFAKSKFVIKEKNNHVEALVSQDKSPKIFVKVDFQKLDSLELKRTNYTKDWREETISIKSDKTLHYSETNILTSETPVNNSKNIKLSNEQYQEIIDYLNNKPLFSNVNDNLDDKIKTSLQLRFQDNSFSIFEHQKVDKTLTDFLFAKAYLWMKEK